MKRIIYIFTLLVATMSVTSLQAVTTGFKAPAIPAFSRYQGILNRMPFGAAPAQSSNLVNPIDAKTAAQEMKEQQLLARKINMSCVNITPAGTPAVGFTDLSVKPAANYYLLVGDDANGWKVLDANYEEEWAELEKDGTTIYVKLGEGLMAEPPTSKTVVAKAKKPSRLHGVKNSAPEQEEDLEDLEKPPPPTIEEQFVNMKAHEIIGGPPSPGITMVKLSSEEQKEQTKVMVQALNEKQKTGAISSYTDRLLQKQIDKEEKRKAEDLALRAELEQIAEEVAKDTIEKQIKEAELLEEELNNEE